jgi:hypothetical protein
MDGSAGKDVHFEQFSVNFSFFHGTHATVFQTEIFAIATHRIFVPERMVEMLFVYRLSISYVAHPNI